MSDEAWNTTVVDGIGEIFKLTVSLGGTLSGEHGVGIAKKTLYANSHERNQSRAHAWHKKRF